MMWSVTCSACCTAMSYKANSLACCCWQHSTQLLPPPSMLPETNIDFQPEITILMNIQRHLFPCIILFKRFITKWYLLVGHLSSIVHSPVTDLTIRLGQTCRGVPGVDADTSHADGCQTHRGNTHRWRWHTVHSVSRRLHTDTYRHVQTDIDTHNQWVTSHHLSVNSDKLFTQKS